MFNDLLKSIMELGIITKDDVKRLTSIELMMLIIERTNGMLEHLNNYILSNDGKVNDLYKKYQEMVVYITNELGNITLEQLNNWVEDGTFEELINETGLKEVNARIDATNQKIEEVATTGTTVDVLERVTKQEITRQIQDGTIANLTIQNNSITSEKLALNSVKSSSLYNRAIECLTPSENLIINFNDKTVTLIPTVVYTTFDRVDVLSQKITYTLPSTDLIYCLTFNIVTKQFKHRFINQEMDKDEYILVVIYGKSVMSLMGNCTVIGGVNERNKKEINYVEPNFPIIVDKENGMFTVEANTFVIKKDNTFKFIKAGTYNFTTDGFNYIAFSEDGQSIKTVPVGKQQDINTKDLVLFAYYQERIFTPHKDKFEHQQDEEKRDYTISPIVIFNDYVSDISKKTKIKILGDSITAGVGGTGYTLTNQQINSLTFDGQPKYKVSESGYCWANLLVKNIRHNYNEVTRELTYLSPELVFSEGNYQDTLSWHRLDRIIPVGSSFEFKMYGNVLSLQTWAGTSPFVIGVKVNDSPEYEISISNVEGFKSGIVTQITQNLVPNQTNKVKITNKGGTFCLEKVNVKQYIDVSNYGLSGWSYKATLHDGNFEQLVESDDDLIIVQLGTNDRKMTSGELKSRIIKFVDKCHQMNKNVILMCSCDSLEPRFQDGRIIEMETVRKVIQEVAELKECAFIDNYNVLNDYAMIKGVSLTTLLPDSLHPNDEGYRVLYHNVAKSLGLPNKEF